MRGNLSADDELAIGFPRSLVLECPLYTFIRYKFQALFEKLVLGSLKYFFQLDHQVDINLYLTEAYRLHHSTIFIYF